MPAKNSTLKNGERFNPLTRELHERFVEDTGIDVDYKTFQKVISDTNKLIGESAIDEEAGVQLPEIGNLLVVKYKSNKQPVDFVSSKKLGKKIPLLNLHSVGYVYHIKWFKLLTNFKHKSIYKFEPYRILKRRVAQNVKAGKKYFKWSNSDLYSATKMERNYNKFYKKEE